MAQPVDFLVDGGILLNIGVRMGNICLRLIIIIVGDEILHRIVGEKLPELAAKLGRQRLVVGKHQGGPVYLFDHRCHGEGLAGAGNTQKCLLRQPQLHAPGQGFNCLRLVTGGAIFRYQLKFIHLYLLP